MLYTATRQFDICKAVTHLTYPIFDMFYHILSLYSSKSKSELFVLHLQGTNKEPCECKRNSVVQAMETW